MPDSPRLFGNFSVGNLKTYQHSLTLWYSSTVLLGSPLCSSKSSHCVDLGLSYNTREWKKRKNMLTWASLKYPPASTARLLCFDTTFSLSSWFTGYISLISYLYLIWLTQPSWLMVEKYTYYTNPQALPSLIDGWHFVILLFFLLFLYDSFQTVRGDCEGC